MTAECTRCYVAVGSNLPGKAGGPGAIVAEAIGQLDVRAASAFYATPAYPPGSGPDFVNAVVALDTALAPDALLDTLHRVEADMGRERSVRWGPRVLDLDLLAVGQAVLPDAATQDTWRALPPGRQTQDTPQRLVLPHPRLQDRAFVLVPWADVAPDWPHPRTGRTVAQMLATLPASDIAAIRRLDPL